MKLRKLRKLRPDSTLLDNALLTKASLIAGDVVALLAAFLLGRTANWAYDHTLAEAFFGWWDERGQIRLALFALVVVVAVGWCWSAGHYSRRKPFWDELRETLRILVLVAAIDVALVFLGKWQFSRLWLLSTWLLAFVLVPVVRVAVKRVLLRMGRWRRPTVIVGAGNNAREAYAALNSEPLMGFEVVAFLAPPGEAVSASSSASMLYPAPVEAVGDDIVAWLENRGMPHIVVALDSLQEQQLLIQRLSIRYADLNVIPSIRGLPLLGMEMTHFFSHEVLMLRVRNNLARRGPQLVKRLFDIAGSATLLVLLAPFFATIAWRIRRDGGRAIYAHGRVGRHGKPFDCYKFRSMIANADAVLAEVLANDPAARAEWERDFKLKNDPRITPVGAFLRKTSLDELPQLWNVLKGEMSMVGPRPIVTEELARYNHQVGYYLEARPGMTGLWQISGRNDVDYADRVNLDAWYVKNWSLWYDIVILLKTVKVVLGKGGAY